MGARGAHPRVTNAAMGGHLHVLQYVREHGCPWDLWACASTSKAET